MRKLTALLALLGVVVMEAAAFTPDVSVDINDFVSSIPGTSEGLPVNLIPIPFEVENYRSRLTDANGQVTISAVTPGTYLMFLEGLGLSDPFTIVVPDQSGPLNALTLVLQADHIFNTPEPRIVGNIMEVWNAGDRIYRFDYGGILAIRPRAGLSGGLSVQSPSGWDSFSLYVTDTLGTPGGWLNGFSMVSSGANVFDFQPDAGDGGTLLRINTPEVRTNGRLLDLQNFYDSRFSVEHDGAVRAGGSEPWKLGSVIPATVQLVTDKYVQVEIGGQIVKLAVVE